MGEDRVGLGFTVRPRAQEEFWMSWSCVTGVNDGLMEEASRVSSCRVCDRTAEGDKLGAGVQISFFLRGSKVHVSWQPSLDPYHHNY